MSHFSFKNLFKRLPNTSIPKEFIYFGIGGVLTVMIGLIAGNMYLQEMLFFEGVEKSLPLFTEEELRTYGEYYKELEIDFQNDIAAYIQDYANRTNRKGEKIKWGVYGQNNTEDLMNDDFVDGVTIKYAKTSGRSDGESNFQDILSAVAIAVDQNQSKDETVVKDLTKELFKLSHTFTGKSTELYPCTHGCFCDYYHCSDAYNSTPFSHCNIKYQPFSIKAHTKYEDYEDEENFEIVDIIGECEVCKDKDFDCYMQRGCEQNGTCYHGTNGSVWESGADPTHSLGTTEPTPEQCTNWSYVYICPGHTRTVGSGEDAYEEYYDHSDQLLGCEGYYYCLGHSHYGCPHGHYYICCMGHTNVTITIKIMYLDEILNSIKDGYDGG